MKRCVHDAVDRKPEVSSQDVERLPKENVKTCPHKNGLFDNDKGYRIVQHF